MLRKAAALSCRFSETTNHNRKVSVFVFVPERGVRCVFQLQQYAPVSQTFADTPPYYRQSPPLQTVFRPLLLCDNKPFLRTGSQLLPLLRPGPAADGVKRAIFLTAFRAITSALTVRAHATVLGPLPSLAARRPFIHSFIHSCSRPAAAAAPSVPVRDGPLLPAVTARPARTATKSPKL